MLADGDDASPGPPSIPSTGSRAGFEVSVRRWIWKWTVIVPSAGRLRSSGTASDPHSTPGLPAHGATWTPPGAAAAPATGTRASAASGIRSRRSTP